MFNARNSLCKLINVVTSSILYSQKIFTHTFKEHSENIKLLYDIELSSIDYCIISDF